MRRALSEGAARHCFREVSGYSPRPFRRPAGATTRARPSKTRFCNEPDSGRDGANPSADAAGAPGSPSPSNGSGGADSFGNRRARRTGRPDGPAPAHGAGNTDYKPLVDFAKKNGFRQMEPSTSKINQLMMNFLPQIISFSFKNLSLVLES